MKSQRPTSNISWPDVHFYAEADGQSFADAQVITLYSHCLNIAEEKQIPLSSIKEPEQVEIFESHIRIVIDEETIDDDAIARGLDLLIHMDNFEVGNKKEFGPPKRFSYTKLHQLTGHGNLCKITVHKGVFLCCLPSVVAKVLANQQL